MNFADQIRTGRLLTEEACLVSFCLLHHFLYCNYHTFGFYMLRQSIVQLLKKLFNLVFALVLILYFQTNLLQMLDDLNYTLVVLISNLMVNLSDKTLEITLAYKSRENFFLKLRNQGIQLMVYFLELLGIFKKLSNFSFKLVV